MDEITVRFHRLERRVRLLSAVVVVLVAGVVAQAFGWLPRVEPSELRTGRIVVSSSPYDDRSVEITDRGIRLVGGEIGETWLGAPTSGGDECLAIDGASGHVGIRPGEVLVTSREGGTLELKSGGSNPILSILGGKAGQADIGPGYASVTGSSGSTVIDGRTDALGLRVIDDKGNLVPQPR